MEDRKVKPEEFARDLEVSLRLVQKWRAGDSLPRLSTQARIASYFEKPLAWFYSGEFAEAVA